MSKTASHTISKYANEALFLLGASIRAARIQKRWSEQELADRMGVSRPLVSRIEGGYPGTSIGAVFEAAALVGVSLFEGTPQAIMGHTARVAEKLALLPQTARKKGKVKDEF
ncbi:helix-turn-helix transcriptional regulator [Ferrovum sp.]|uniref:helix-turn-helix transcriptional regulator n=1 Tax=Ferrovum sp. TaxID=2609467 RepID=UPI00260EDBE6|nr:helix-turn-helix transcriptional regulator [Ferrovum sp.]